MKNNSPYTFKKFSFDGYKAKEKSTIFFLLPDMAIISAIVMMDRKDVESNLLKYPDCKELKKALKLYKLLDKYAK